MNTTRQLTTKIDKMPTTTGFDRLRKLSPAVAGFDHSNEHGREYVSVPLEGVFESRAFRNALPDIREDLSKGPILGLLLKSFEAPNDRQSRRTHPRELVGKSRDLLPAYLNSPADVTFLSLDFE